MESKIDYKLREYWRYKNFVKFLLLSSGIWADPQAQSQYLRVLLRIVSGFATLSASFFIIGFIIFEANSINLYMRGFGIIIGFWSSFMKTYILAVNQKDLQYLDENVSASFERDIKDSKKHYHAMKHLSVIANLCWISTAIFCIGNFLLIRTVLVLAMKDIYIRMYPFHLPFNVDQGGTLYWIQFVYQVYACYYLTTLTVGADSVFGYYSLHLTGELGVLREEYLNLKFSKDYDKDLKACVERNRMIQKSLPVLEKTYAFLSIWLLITCSGVICGQVWQISKMESITIGRAVYIVMYFGAKITQCFSYSYCGYAITTESEKSLQGIYESHWPESGNKKFMNDLIIMLSQRPLVFNAMGFMNLGFDLFSSTLNASLSYYMLLRTMEDKDEK